MTTLPHDRAGYRWVARTLRCKLLGHRYRTGWYGHRVCDRCRTTGA